jgi:DNA-directed RNA polymerase specialized sigma24 family protein
MNGTDAGGVHGAVEAIRMSEGVDRPLTFETFFEAERVRLLRALYLLTGNTEEAEEVLHEAFIAIWERWERVQCGVTPPAG